MTSPSPAPRSRLGLRPLALVALLGLALAVLLRWPISVTPAALPLDPNSALHAVTAWDLGHAGSPWRLASLSWPDGMPTRVLAWPLLLVATPLGLVLPPLPAFSLAVLIWLALGVVAVAALGRAWGWPWPRAALTAVAATACAPHVFQRDEGRYENLVVLPLALAAWGAPRATAGGLLAVTIGAVGAALSSPYQAVPAGLVVLALATLGGRRALVRALAGLAVAATLAVPYYRGAAGGAGHGGAGGGGAVGPADAVHVEPAALAELVLPRAHPPPPMPPPRAPAARLARLADPPATAAPGPAMPFHTPAAASYLGLALILAGGAGLWRARREPHLRAFAVAGACCLLLALGARLHLVTGQATALPLPWSLAGHLPGLAEMQVTLRFLTGVGLALAVGAGALAGSSWPRAAALGAVILADSLLLNPASWPVEGVVPAAALPIAVEGPLATWPGTPTTSGHQLAVLRLALDRPLASFDTADLPPPAPGAQAVSPPTNLHGEDLAAWLRRVQAAGAQALVVPAGVPGGALPPLGVQPTCAGGLCMWDLRAGVDALRPGQPAPGRPHATPP